jgi:glycosyltransferase involved in cell wall biosynthesis
VACSNVTSLTEVAADAAILFDPRIPTQIVAAINTLVENEIIRSRLIDAGRLRAIEFADSDRMTQEYWDLFLEAANQKPQVDLLTGIYSD